MKIDKLKKKFEELGYNTCYNGEDLLDVSFEEDSACFLSVTFDEDSRKVNGMMFSDSGVKGRPFLSLDIEVLDSSFYKSKR